MKRFTILICLASIFVLYLTPSFPVSNFLHQLERSIWDVRVRSSTINKDNDLLFIGVNRKRYKQYFEARTADPNPTRLRRSRNFLKETFPWNHRLWANLVDRLLGQGSAEVVVFPWKVASSSPGSEQFPQILMKYPGRVVVMGKSPNNNSLQRNRPESHPTNSCNKEQLKPGGQVGFDGLSKINDTRRTFVRKYQYKRLHHGDTYAYSLAFQTVGASADGAEMDLSENIPAHPTRIQFVGEPGSYSYIPLPHLFLPDRWDELNERDLFEGKTVLIGLVEDWHQDYYRTPMSPERMSGAELQLNAITTLKEEAFLVSASPTLEILLILGLGFIASLILFGLHRSGAKLLCFVLVGLGYFTSVEILFRIANLLLPVLFPVLSFVLIGLTSIACEKLRY